LPIYSLEWLFCRHFARQFANEFVQSWTGWPILGSHQWIRGVAKFKRFNRTKNYIVLQLMFYSGKNFTFLWLRDYQIFLRKNKQKFDGCNLQKFLIDLEYQFWASFIRLRNDG
jgi:hypothetical protein